MRPEKHLGIVSAINSDPNDPGSLKIRAPGLVEGQDLGGTWIQPSFNFAGDDEGVYFVPQPGGLVEVEVEADAERATEDLDARWVASKYNATHRLPSEFRSNPTQRMGIKVRGGTILFDRVQQLLALISAKLRLGIEGATHPVMRGDTYNQSLDTWLEAMILFLDAASTLTTANSTQFTALQTAAIGTLAPLAAAFGALASAWTTFGAAIATFKTATTTRKSALSTWLSTMVNTE